MIDNGYIPESDIASFNNLISQIREYEEEFTAKITTSMRNQSQVMEKLVFICENIFSRNSIEQRMNELYNEENDKKNGNVKKENISGGATNASGAKYFSYGMDNEAERGAKKDNGTSAYLPCYKTNKGTSLLKEVEFNGRDEEFAKEGLSKEGHGDIYCVYVDQQQSRALAAKLDTANGTFAYETYNKLSS